MFAYEGVELAGVTAGEAQGAMSPRPRSPSRQR